MSPRRADPGTSPTSITRLARALAVPACLSLVLVAGCGTESGTGSDTGSGAGGGVQPETTATDPVPPVETTSPPVTDSDSGDAALGTVLVDASLPVTALEYPGPPLPASAEVSDAEELASVFAGAPGLDKVVADVAASPPVAGERMFVYVLAACTMDDLSLRVRGNELEMIVAGTSAIKCEPPAMHMVVWTVGADEVPADVVAGRAVQK